MGRGIKSTLFTRDPVPIRQDNNIKTAYDNMNTFIAKGEKHHDKHNHNDSDDEASEYKFEHIGGDDDTYVIKDIGGAYNFHRNILKKSMRELQSYSSTYIKDLPIEVSEAFKSVIESIRRLKNTRSLYNLILKDVQDVFGDHKVVKPGTLCSYFIGCFDDDNFSGPPDCNPKCVSSITPADHKSYCSDLVLMYLDNNFSTLNDKHSTHVYVYVENESFKGFTHENINQLHSHNVKYVTIIYGSENSNDYKEVSTAIAVDDLPLCGGKSSSSFSTSSSSSSSSKSDHNGNSTAGIVICVIILLILLIGLAYLAYREYRKNSWSNNFSW